MGKTGGGAICGKELRTESRECLPFKCSNYFPVKFLQPFYSSTFGFTLVELLVVIAIIGVLIALLLPAVQAAREAARRTECTNKLKQLGIALHNHHDTYGFFPSSSSSKTLGTDKNTAANRDRIGFLPAFLPFIEQQAIYDLIQTSVNSTLSTPCNWIWDNTHTGATTTRIGAQPIAAIQCPSDSEAFTKPNVIMARINYRPILGDTVLPNGLVDCQRSLFRKGTDGETTFSSVTDGTSNSVVLAESGVAFDFSKKTHIIGGAGIVSGLSTTSKPSDCTALIAGGGLINSTAITTTDLQNRMYGRRIYEGRMAVLSLVTVLPPNSPTCGNQTQWDNAITINTVSSYHTGGANVTLADASVRFISQTIDAGDPNQLIATVTGIAADHYKDYTGPSIWGVWGALGTINCGEVKSP
ncbi:MAG: DUF1559 domain-containing protein [Planctomycetaceae bacterium]|nr:DUF1559 domain-containing protein [Planctomycetaceae bacterium]